MTVDVMTGGQFVNVGEGWHFLWMGDDYGPFDRLGQAKEVAERIYDLVDSNGGPTYGCCGVPVNLAEVCRCDAAEEYS